MIEVRLAKAYDVVAVAGLMKQHREEVKEQSTLDFDWQLTVDNLERVVNTKGQYLLVAHDFTNSHCLFGYLWVSIVQPHFSNQYFLAEHYTFVRKDKRSGRVLLKLLQEANAIAQITGCEFFSVANVSGIDSCTRAYDKRFKKVGSVYHYKEGK